MPFFHTVFDKFYPAIRYVHEQVNGNPWFSEIIPGIWLGGAPTEPRDYRFLRDHGINAVVNIRAERKDDLAFYARHDITHLQLKVYDMLVPESADLETGSAFIEQQVQDGRTVLVHCAKGRVRSAVLLAAWLIKYRGLTWEEAVALLKAQRPLVKQEERHRRAVARWLAEYPPGEDPTP
jgi:atypical dual specificity phosphatase